MNRRTHLLPILLAAAAGIGADWPMWRADPARRGTSEEELPETLHLQWVLELPAPRPAWPAYQEKLQFDRLYEPILVGKLLFVGSMVSDKVTAHDSETGAERWSFYADGPVRLAPAAWNGKVYFTADDGYLYCLAAADGALQWKFRGGPGGRLVLGQDRLISAWPARGAPVIHDGTVYFAAGIWPFEGTFLYALNAETGAVIWSQSGTGANYTVQQHSSPAFGGVAPQGYMAATAEHLIVSGGRTVPAVFDRRTGKLIHFIPGSRDMGSKGGGGYEVAAGRTFLLNRGQMYRMDDGQFVANVDAPILTEHAMIGLDADGLRAWLPGWRETQSADRRGAAARKMELRTSWTAGVELKLRRLFLKSGSRLYASAEKGAIAAIDLPRFDRGAHVSWTTTLPDEPLNMLAGDGKLFVTSDRGRIYCFGGAPRGARMPARAEVVVVPRGAEWKYLDDGSDQGTAWRSIDFDDGKWKRGPATLGYGNGREATKLSYGSDAKKKPMTCYFRREIEVAAPEGFGGFTLKVLADDGAVVYLNGEEVARFSLPAGSVTFQTAANPKSEESKYDEARVAGAGLLPGKNVLAVEVHQATSESSDLAFDLELAAVPESAEPRASFPPDRWTEVAHGILAATGAREGYCLALGIGSGRLVEEIASQSRLHVIAIDPDAGIVDACRRRLDRLGLYGRRVAVLTGDVFTLELPPYLAELVVAEEPAAAGLGRGRDFIAAVFPTLRPESGVACFAAGGAEAGAFLAAAAAERLDGGVAEERGGFLYLRRVAPPAGAADWTHQYADAANTVVSSDTLVKAPLGLLWFGGPSNEEVLPRHGHGPTPQVAGGRLFIEGRNMLRAVDIYTGRLLWQRTLKDVGQYYDYTSHEAGANAIGSNYVSLRDGIYVIHERKCLRLDPASGATLAGFMLPVASGETTPPDWGFLAAAGDHLIAGVKPGTFRSTAYSARELRDLKGDLLKAALALFLGLKDFQGVPKEKDQDDLDWFVANINKLLFEEDLLAKVPEKVRREAKAEEIEKQLAMYLDDFPGAGPNDYEALVLKRQLLARYYKLPAYAKKTPGKLGSVERIGSKGLAVLDRQTGETRWRFEAEQEIRHNAIAAGGGKVFVIDRMSPDELSLRKRRGETLAEGGRLLALDLETGEVVWRIDRPVFGTWLSYSEEHDALLQAGSKASDRSLDEIGQGMAVHRGRTGELLWQNEEKYSGPCLLLGDAIITQGYGTPGFAFDLLTGKRKKRVHPVSGAEIDWQYVRNYGCNTAVGCPNLLTFRSAAAGYYDLATDGGTGNFGGFRSGCTSNLIPAGGVLSAPDYTRTCTCSYQNQASLALVHSPEGEAWTFNRLPVDPSPVRQLGLNLGAPGDRRGPDGTLWLEYPSVGGESPEIPIEVFMEGAEYIRHHSSRLEAGELPWISASGVKGAGEIALQLVSSTEVACPNEVAGGPPLTATGAMVSAAVPVRALPQGGGRNETSLARVARGDLKAVVRGLTALLSPSITVEFWARTDADIDYVDTRTSEGDTTHGFVIENREVRVRYFTAVPGGGRHEPTIIATREKVPENRWVHVAFTYDARSGTGILYRDGKAVGTHRGAPGRPLLWPRSPPDVVVGRAATSRTNIDELRIASVALPPSEFLRAEGGGAPPENLAGWWRMTPAAAGPGSTPARIYTVRLVFAEIEGLAAGARRFDVALQGRERLTDFDIAREAGGPWREIVKEFHEVAVRDHLRITLTPRGGAKPVLCGIQAILQARGF